MTTRTLYFIALIVPGVVWQGIAQDTFVPNNLILDGSNKWMFHSPDDGRTSLFLVPSPDGSWNWNWNAVTTFANNGDVYFPGKIGVGGSTPGAKLDVVGPATGTGISIRASGGGDVVLNSGGSLFFDGNYNYASGNFIRPVATNTQSFVTAGIERIRINPNGRIGIGTSSTPISLLSNATSAVGGNATDGFVWKSAENNWTATIQGMPSSGAGFGLRLHTTGETANDIPLLLSSGATSKFFVRGDGRVAIGTASPVSLLSNTTASVGGNSNDGFVWKSVENNWTATIYGAPASGAGYGLRLHTNGATANDVPLNVSSGAGSGTSKLFVRGDGYVGIGTAQPDQKLTVNGTVHATSVKVESTVPAPDYVFENSYALPTLDEVKSYIDENKHLPEVPSAKEMEAKGIDVGEMNMLLLKKVEELTLYLIELKQENKAMKSEIDDLKKT